MKAISMGRADRPGAAADDRRAKHAGASDDSPKTGYRGRHRKESQETRPAA